MPNTILNNTQKLLLELLKSELGESAASDSKGAASWDFYDVDMEELVHLAKAHAVISFIAGRMTTDDSIRPRLSPALLEECSKSCEAVVVSGHRLLYLTDRCLKKLDKAGVSGVALKGWAVAGYFDIPEQRKVGDVDILVADDDLKKAVGVIEQDGFYTVAEQRSVHHIELADADDMVVEIHNMLVEPFDDSEINERIRQIGSRMLEHTEYFEYNGFRIRRAQPEYNAISLILHMLQHYMRAGFGLKLLCDWVVFMDRGIGKEQYQRFMEMTDSLGISEFVKMINGVCHRYLGMKVQDGVETVKDEKTLAMFMRDLFEGEEFGHADSNRMVVINGSGAGAYIREFHHQMKLNNPNASKWWIIWPYLWGKTLAVFLINNKKIRKTSTLDILKNAGKRGKIVQDMKLFERKK